MTNSFELHILLMVEEFLFSSQKCVCEFVYVPDHMVYVFGY